MSTPAVVMEQLERAAANPREAIRWRQGRSFHSFLVYFWPVVAHTEFVHNWHIEYLCDELMGVARRRAARMDAVDYVINVPPGTTKTITCNIMFPAWCWTKWFWMRFIASSYSYDVSCEAGEYCRDLVRSDAFQDLYPEISIKEDKDAKSNFRIVHRGGGIGGGRYSTSVGGTMTGFHADINLVDDPLNPNQAVSAKELDRAIRWYDNTLPTRKTDKRCSATITIQQRLVEGDPSGHQLAKGKKNVRHICLPADINDPRSPDVSPPELAGNYTDGLLDPQRMPRDVLADMEVDLGQFAYAAQILQNPAPPGGQMFDADRFVVIQTLAGQSLIKSVRYWDKAGTEASVYNPDPAWTVGTKIAQTSAGKYIVMDVVRGRWSADKREEIIRRTAEADGRDVHVWVEQEPGSGGKESAEATIRNLAGFVAKADRPTGDKVYRADPWAVQVNGGNVMLLRGDWNRDYVEEHRGFPRGRYKDQVDSSSGGFAKLAAVRKKAWVLK